MITATLYRKQGVSEHIELSQLGLRGDSTELMPRYDDVAFILTCPSNLVDVLATGDNYLVFSIFDYEGEENIDAMRVLDLVTGQKFSELDSDEVIQGPVLIIQKC